MSIFDRSRVVTMGVGSLLALALLRCGAPDQCLRISDCSAGLTCIEGSCVPEGADPSAESGVLEASLAEGAAAIPTDATVDTAVSDAARAGDATAEAASDASVDAPSDGGVIVPFPNGTPPETWDF